MNRRRIGSGIALVVVIALAWLVVQWRSSPGPADAGLELSGVLGGDDVEGFARAIEPRDFQFPVDHGPHPTYRNEWWYFTGNLRTPEGRRFGYELTLFRFALAADPPVRSSAWAARQVYMGHFAVTDVDGGKFHFFERLARDGAKLAGAGTQPLRVWVEDWRIAGSPDGTGFPWRLSAADVQEDAPVAISLALVPDRPVVLQGERGLSRKSAAPGNASYYYSMPRMDTRGTLVLGDETFAVEGTSWLDREWGTSALGEDQVGWDWFALQLDDGYDLMFYQLRRRDGSVDPFSAGSLVDPSGKRIPINRDEVAIEVLDHWDSPHGGRYPARWRLQLPAHDLTLEIAPLLAAQELALGIRYWEGAVAATGMHRGREVRAEGYVELTGYASRPTAMR